MAVLCPSVKYGLLSQQSFGENKDVIFLKLTDSALRAIEDYLKHEKRIGGGHSPTIRFLGNEGQLSFPSAQHGNTSFNFSMSSTADMEGPGGSFECVQRSDKPSHNSLELLGTIPYKIRVHANDDVYEATRHRMTIAEENLKNKCAREIKLNQKDIGRKVKVQQRSSLLPTRSRDVPISNAQKDSAKVLHSSGAHLNNNKSPFQNLSNGLSNNLSNSRLQGSKPSSLDVNRRPIKERLIHLLALRPYKKVELHECLKDNNREKYGMTSILKQIAFMKDNCYHLNRVMWNEVNEDWPFYTESEKQILKRRKPENLTPPGSDGGSSGSSGQSPNSTHAGSPTTLNSSKRPATTYHDVHDTVPTKRQRISHYRKPTEPICRSPADSANTDQRRPHIDSRDSANTNPRSRELCSPLSNGYTPSPPNGGAPPAGEKQQHYINDCDETANRKRTCDINNVSALSFAVNRDRKLLENHINHHNVPTQSVKSVVAADSLYTSAGNELHVPNGKCRSNGKDTVTLDTKINSFSEQHQIINGVNVDSQESNSYKKDKTTNGKEWIPPHYGGEQTVCALNSIDMVAIPNDKSSTSIFDIPSKPTHNNGNSNNQRIFSNDQRAKRIEDTIKTHTRSDNTEMEKRNGYNTLSSRKFSSQEKSQFPDYLTEYTTIKDVNQRRQYKADFNADYAEYKDLHGVVEKISARFSELENRLKQEDPSSPRYKDIKRQIVQEYQEKKKDVDHQKAKQRFQYLHEKLSHIKRLVLEYDQSLTDNRY